MSNQVGNLKYGCDVLVYMQTMQAMSRVNVIPYHAPMSLREIKSAVRCVPPQASPSSRLSRQLSHFPPSSQRSRGNQITRMFTAIDDSRYLARCGRNGCSVGGSRSLATRTVFSRCPRREGKGVRTLTIAATVMVRPHPIASAIGRTNADAAAGIDGSQDDHKGDAA